jgi:PAS domain S-box-containing protein
MPVRPVSKLRLQEWTARWGWLLAIAALVVLLGTTYYLDLQNRHALEAAQREAASAAEREAASLAEGISAEAARRVGALTAAKLQFTQVEAAVSEALLMAAVDSVIVGLPGLVAVNVIYPDSTLTRSRAALLGRMWLAPLDVPEVGAAYDRSIETQRPAATPVLDLLGQRRFVVFDPVMGEDTAGVQEVRAVLAAELEPLALLRSALREEQQGFGPAFYDIYDPAGTRVTTVPAPVGWPRLVRPIAIADTEWTLAVAHQPVHDQPFQVVSAAIRLSGVLLALGFAIALLFLWRTVRSQQNEIRRRLAAEARARENAAEAASRAAEARGLSEQLASAQDISLRLSAALDPDRVIDDYLGAVGEELDADAALLYMFDETGDAVVGRRRLILNPNHADSAPRADDFRDVRVPVSLMPHLAEPVATGEPYLAAGAALEGQPGPGVTRPSALLSVPLTIAGHLVGLAVWETYGSQSGFHERNIPFVRAVSAQAAAILRAAELLDGVRSAQQRATKEATRLATVLDQLVDGVILFDRAGDPERVNPAAESLLSPAVRETSLVDWPSIFGIRQGGRPLGEDFQLLRARMGERVDGVRFTVREGASEKYVAASAAPIKGREGTVQGVAVVVRDITAEHEYAEMLRYTNQELRQQATLLERANDELRAATTAKDQFLAMMSHELRTPINAIIGYADLLDIGVHGGLNEKQRGMVSRVVETSRHLLGLINDVLDLTKIGAGRLDMRIEAVPVHHVVSRAVHQVTPLAETKDLEVGVVGTGSTRALADETRLSQILINLASNAVKFTEHGGIELEYGESEDRVMIKVRDTGPGIPDDELDRVFEEFHQVDAGHSRSAGGTGLGLAIARRLARLMGGDLTVESEVGVGSVFTIDLPSANNTSADADPVDEPMPHDLRRQA